MKNSAGCYPRVPRRNFAGKGGCRRFCFYYIGRLYNRGRFQEDWGISHKQDFTESSLNNYRKRGIVYTIGK